MMQRLLATILAVFSLSACDSKSGGHSHSSVHPGGHNHHEEGHGHGDIAPYSQTLWSEGYELFLENSPGVVGTESDFLLQLTDLDGFRALANARVRLELTGPAGLEGESNMPLSPGTFRIQLSPNIAGSYRGSLIISRKDKEDQKIEGIEFEVFADAKTAHAQVREAEHEGLIEFFKEQQWGVPFMTSFAAESSLSNSIEVSGRIDTPPGGRAKVGAPFMGILSPPTNGFTRPGTVVHKGDVLAKLSPTLSSPESAANVSLVVAEAQARSSAAQSALSRAQRLIANNAISERELEDARRETKVAAESVRAARRASRLHSGVRGTGKSVSLRAPIDGTIVSVQANPGASVSPGELLFEIINTDELWIVAQVPEQEAAHLQVDGNASYRVAGFDNWVSIDLQSPDGNASVVSVARIVHPKTRTVEVLYSLTNPDKNLRIGGLVQVSLPAGEKQSGIVIPRTALVNQEGRDMVYVQVNGEHFQERLVRVGSRAGGLIAIVEGLTAGERIVTVGAHLVRLADRANSSAPAHGHVH